MSTQQELFAHFNLKKPKDEADLDILETMTYRKIKKSIESLIEDNKWRAYSGRIGSGKTVTIIGAVREIHDRNNDFDVVEILSPNRKLVTANQVLQSFILQMGEKYLGSKKVNNGTDARYAQVQRILMAANSKSKKILLIVDEAQELNTIVLNTIKRLRDTTFIKRSIHLPVILIGQPSLESMIQNNEEVKSRIRNSQFGYTKKELVDITVHLSNGLLSRDECLQIVRLNTGLDEFRNKKFPTPLELKQSIEIAMENAFNADSQNLGIQHFEFPNLPNKEPKPKPAKVEIDAAKASEMIQGIESKSNGSKAEAS